MKFTSLVGPVVTLGSLDSVNEFDQPESYVAPFNRYIGTSSPWSDYAPSWHITIDNASDVPLSGDTNYRSGDTVPVVTASLLIRYDTRPLEDDSLFYSLRANENLTLDVQELNTLFKVNGNYDVEIFKVDESNRPQSLQFINPDSEFAANLFYQANAGTLSRTIEGTEEGILQAYPTLDSRYVEYYFDILLDQEIGGIQMPTQSTIYRRNIDREPGDICNTIDSIGSAEDWGL